MEYSAVNTIWVLVGAALVFFMQAGFAMVETGFTRAKNAGNIIMKNLMDFCLGTPIFWLLGFGLMFGGGGMLIGKLDPGILNDYSSMLPAGVPLWAYVIFQTVFCATAATIVSGAMAERTKFSAYCIYSVIISAVIYPISGHWIWGGGWLAQLGFHDFAGSTAVHMVGGVAAFVGARMIGPRIGKYDRDGKSLAIPGHSLTLGALGCFILWFCWFGFNGCSTVSMEGGAIESAGHIFMTTNLCAAVATVTVMCITWIRYKKPDVSMTLNGSLAGLVAITAGCDAVSPTGAALIGVISGFIVVFGIELIDQKIKIDDPVGAIGVHGLCGAGGTILTGFFSTKGGVFYGGGFHMVWIQILGVVAVALWVFITMNIVFMVLKHTIGLRVTKEEEVLGLDKLEHGLVSAYADFMAVPSVLGTSAGEKAAKTFVDAIPVKKTSDMPNVKMTKVVIITKMSQFEELKNAMNEIGITGMTVSHVMGCGIQKGNTNDLYRGVPMAITLLPQIQMDIVVSEIPVETVVEAAKRVLYTGHVGDGKIFVYDVENVIKIRTGEEGYPALQDIELE